MRTLAVDTWRFYERYVTAADHHLPPDNVQFAPREMVAHRTSPTNIGLYLLATAAAREMGLISLLELIVRLEHTLTTVEALPRWRGHLFNWYDTQTLTVLSPAYVSAVDSGNLSGHLLVLSSACTEFAATPITVDAEPADTHARLLGLAARAPRWRWPPTSGRCTTGGAGCFTSACAPKVNTSMPATTTCWRRNRACAAWWPSPRAMCHAPLGHARAPAVRQRQSRGPEIVVGIDVRVSDALAGAQ